MSDPIDALYQELILKHYRNPQHSTELDEDDCTAEGFNPTCGDRVRLNIQREGDTLLIKHQTTGCAVCIASSSIMACQLNHWNVKDASGCIEQVLEYLQKDDVDLSAEFAETDVAALSSVKPFPMRMKCATLPWTVLQEALKK